jgi:hypothetical protein
MFESVSGGMQAHPSGIRQRKMQARERSRCGMANAWCFTGCAAGRQAQQWADQGDTMERAGELQ